MFASSTDSTEYFFKQNGRERLSVFDGAPGPLPTLPEIARSFKFNNMKKALRNDHYVHHVDILDSDEQSSGVSLSASRPAASKSGGPAKREAAPPPPSNKEDESDSDEESLFSDMSTNVFDKFAVTSFVPYR